MKIEGKHVIPIKSDCIYTIDIYGNIKQYTKIYDVLNNKEYCISKNIIPIVNSEGFKIFNYVTVDDNDKFQRVAMRIDKALLITFNLISLDSNCKINYIDGNINNVSLSNLSVNITYNLYINNTLTIQNNKDNIMLYLVNNSNLNSSLIRRLFKNKKLKTRKDIYELK